MSNDKLPCVTLMGKGGEPLRRTFQACDSCNRRKVKCDGFKPSCSNCLKSNIECTYHRIAKKRGPERNNPRAVAQSLVARNRFAAEQRAQKHSITPLTTGPDTAQFSSRGLLDHQEMANEPEFHLSQHLPLTTSASFAGDEFRGTIPRIDSGAEVNSVDLTTQKSNLYQKEQQAQLFYMEEGPPVRVHDQALFPSNQQQSALAVPPQPYFGKQSDHYLALEQQAQADTQDLAVFKPSSPYMDSLDLSFLDQELQASLIKIYYSYINTFFPIIPPGVQPQRRFLRYTIYLLAMRFHPAFKSDETRHISESMYNLCRDLMDEELDVIHWELVAGQLLLCLYAMATNRGNAAWMHAGMAIREVQDGYFGHGYSRPPEKEAYNQVFWMSYIVDRMSSAAAYRKIFITDQECKIRPIPAAHYRLLDAEKSLGDGQGVSTWRNFSTSSLTELIGDDNHDLTIHLILLMRILGRIIEEAEPTGPSRIQEATSTPEKLSEWYTVYRQRYDADMLLNSIKGKTVDMVAPETFRALQLYLHFYSVTIAFHRQKYKDQVKNEQPLTNSALHSLLVSHEASKHILRIAYQCKLVNPTLAGFGPFVGFSIYEGAIVHALALEVLPEGKDLAKEYELMLVYAHILEAISDNWECVRTPCEIYKHLCVSTQTRLGLSI